ncbi:MAG TPA: aspartate-semialdehyde dehydrogenase, partial [Planctomycetota bacterium]|nr:aspartate-semialdehyde dehydrogenase [Planctomycetota bacterium]
HHPWMEVRALCASEGRGERAYGDTVAWAQDTPIPALSAALRLRDPGQLDPKETPLVFSALPGSLAGPIETALAQRGFWVVSNAASHRMDANVPLLVPEVNRAHLELLRAQPGPGAILNGPNCSTAGLVLALAPLAQRFGLATVLVTTLQAHSGAGLPGVLGPLANRNVLPRIEGEEDKLETEPRKILGALSNGQVEPLEFAISAMCNRVDVLDGHTECVSVGLQREASFEQIQQAWSQLPGLDLPSAPKHPARYLADPQSPNPVQHKNLDHGMSVVIGQLRPCPVLDWKFTLLSHNTLRGAAGGAILIAEIAIRNGLKG